jgi:hypothetical protein
VWRFVDRLEHRWGYALSIVGLSSAAPSVAVCDSKIVDGSVTVAHVSSSPSSPTRLVLCQRDPTPGAVDGAWWPKSLDLKSELPDLLAVFGLWIGAVHRVVYDPSAWLAAPTRLLRHSEMVSLHPYRLVFSDTIYLMGTHSRDAVLFVLQPSSSEEAQRFLCEVSTCAEPMNAGAMRQLARRCVSGNPETDWSGLEEIYGSHTTSPVVALTAPPATDPLGVPVGPDGCLRPTARILGEPGPTQAPITKGRDV